LLCRTWCNDLVFLGRVEIWTVEGDMLRGDGGMCHAGEGKVAFGMTVEQRKVMPEREKWLLA